MLLKISSLCELSKNGTDDTIPQKTWRSLDVDDVNIAKGICWAKVRRSMASACSLHQAKLILDRVDALENRGSQDFGYTGELPHVDEPFHRQADYHGPEGS